MTDPATTKKLAERAHAMADAMVAAQGEKA